MLWLLGDPSDRRVLAAQNHLLGAVSRGGIHAINLVPEDYARIAELNQRYADLLGDFADLTLVTLSERLVSRMPASEADQRPFPCPAGAGEGHDARQEVIGGSGSSAALTSTGPSGA